MERVVALAVSVATASLDQLVMNQVRFRFYSVLRFTISHSTNTALTAPTFPVTDFYVDADPIGMEYLQTITAVDPDSEKLSIGRKFVCDSLSIIIVISHTIYAHAACHCAEMRYKILSGNEDDLFDFDESNGDISYSPPENGFPDGICCTRSSIV